MGDVKPERIGLYEVADLLAQAEGRAVHRVHDPAGRPLVVKRYEHGAAEAAGFAELLLLGVSHPGLATPLDAGRTAVTRSLFTVFEFVDGPTLGPEALAGRSLTADDRVLLAARLLAAVAVVHDRGLLHRDIKDDNVVLEAGTDRPVLLDFGLCVDADAVTPADLSGTPRAFAPELFGGLPASVASDLWACGLLLAEAFLGRRLFVGQDTEALAAERRAHPGLDAAAHEQLDCAPLAALLDRLLSPDPTRRPVDARAAMAALPLPDDGRRAALHREELTGSRTAACAARDPRLALQVATLRRGRVWLDLFPGSDTTTSEALARLVRLVESVPEPSEALRVRLGTARGATAAPATFASLAEIAGRGQLVLGASLAGVATEDLSPDLTAEREAVLERLDRTAGVLVERAPAPSVDDGQGVLDAWLGSAPVLAERLASSPPRSWAELDDALAELVRTGAVVRDAAGVHVDEGRLPAAWPLTDGGRSPVAEGTSRDVLELLAFLPDAMPAATLAAVLGQPVAEALDELCLAGHVVRRRSRPDDLYAVADGRLRRAVLAAPTLPADRRLALARSLATGPVLDEARAAAIANLLGEAVPGGDDDGVSELAQRAADELRRVGRLELAAALLQRAVDGVRPGAPIERQLLLDLADVLVRGNQYERAEAVLSHATARLGADGGVRARSARVLQLRGRLAEGLALLADFDPASVPRDDAVFGLRQRSDLQREQGHVSEALRDLRDALRLQGNESSRQAIALLDRLGSLEARQGRADDAVRHLERAIAMARELGHDGLVWGPLYKIGRTIRARGERLRGLSLQEESARLAEAAGQKAGLAAILNSLGAGWLALGRLDVARRELSRALELVTELGDDVSRAMVLNNTGRVLAAEGRHDEAEQAFADSLALREERQDVRGQAAVALYRGAVRLDRGRGPAAREDLALARRCLAGLEAPEWDVEADLLDARLLLTEGPPAAAVPLAQRALELARTHSLEREGLVARDLLARAGADDLEDVVVAEAESGPWLADLAVTRAAARVADGRRADADSDLAAALSILGETPDGVVEARAVIARATLDLDQLETLGAIEDHDAGRVGELVSRVSRDLDQARDLVGVHDLQPLAAALDAQVARQQALDFGADMSGLVPLAERLHNLERLVEINKQLNTERNSQVLLDLIVDGAIDLTGADRGFLILFNGKREEFRAARHFDESTIHDPQNQVSHSVARKVAREGRPLLTANAIDDERLASAASITELKLLSILCVPLVSRGRTLGAVYLDHPQVVGRFRESHLETVMALAEQAAIALENARLSDGLERSNTELVASKEEVGRLNEALEERLQRREAELEQTRESLDASRRAMSLRYDYSNIVTRSPRMYEVLDQLDRITGTHFPVVIYGESGTGKELLAKAIHCNGARSDQNFLSINCAAISEQLIESELFGSVRGAFTGADRDRKGLFALAHKGTLFLDEIGEMSLAVQKRLLRVLQEGEFMPVGGREIVRVDVRILCATHRNLKEMKDEGSFREDVYFRLMVGRIEVPPLRDRTEDIALLLPYLLERHGGEQLPIEPEALRLLEALPWPGNVRELENFAMNLLLFGHSGRIDANLVRRVLGQPDGQGAPEPLDDGADASAELPLKARLEAFERRQVSEALERAGGNKTQAARDLGVGVRSLYKMIERLGL